MSSITINEANISDKSILRNLMQLYQHDLSVYDHADVDAHGLYNYNYLDLYWFEVTRFPYIVQCEGQIAGFVLLRQGVHDFRTDAVCAELFSIAEFFVLRKYRRRGIGQFVAEWAFAQFQGRWQVRTPVSNEAAQAFWDKLIARIAVGDYERFIAEDAVVFQFTNAKS